MYELDAADFGISLRRTTAKTVRAEPAAGSNGGEGQVCPRCGERHERDGPNGRPCQMQAGAGEPPF